jgi:hypothetical protein
MAGAGKITIRGGRTFTRRFVDPNEIHIPGIMTTHLSRRKV